LLGIEGGRAATRAPFLLPYVQRALYGDGMTDSRAPVGPPNGVTHPASRRLIAALYEYDWSTQPVVNGSAVVISPDFTRVMTVAVDGDRLLAYIDGERKLLSRAIEYVKGE
jgi:hypothetical protein